MRINRKLLPIKVHFFFFMAALGPILPQLPVYGKELGISVAVMGSITGILPFAFLLAKPAFGLLVDVYRVYRKAIFITLIVVMTASFAAINFVPARTLLATKITKNSSLAPCNETVDILTCDNKTVTVICTSDCFPNESNNYIITKKNHHDTNYEICSVRNFTILLNKTCSFDCLEDTETDNGCLYKSSTFWGFIILMSIGTIGFNVINSISDAICCDVVGNEYDYGKQRVWGTVGFGLTALISGYIVDVFSDSTISYTPAFVVMLVCSVIDILSCIKLELPVIEAPENILQDLKKLLNNRHVITFITFAVFSGVLDSLIIYFLFWYLEDLAVQSNTTNIKLIEGLIVAAETLGGEVLFFYISGKILERIGHVHCFSMCFVNYALRLGLISIVQNPWWVLPVEFFLQGPTYALTYTTVVAYANELAPPGTSATMQGLAAGMDDGVGYAIGSIIGGFLYKYVGGRATLQIFSAFGLVCGIAHLVLHKTLLKNSELPDKTNNGELYKTPEEAYNATTSNI